ncbi:hypothetical protein FXO38_03816 [Capsicum annuum]|nr:hypothetical protein FXO37_36534 [Capsicum annuum]KAF3677404.1 hypothetical protein FXO38_03816 [Capsicum annuum]
MGRQWSAGKLSLILDTVHWNPEAPPQALPPFCLRCIKGLINYGEWIISDDESLTKFLRAPCDYASQVKLNILQVYVKKERKTCRAHSPAQTNAYAQLENPTSVGDAYLTHYSNFFDMNASQYIMSVGTDGNGSIFPLAFAIAVNESLNSDLYQYVMRGHQGITLIPERHHGIHRSVSIEQN